jgi:DNA polymerase I
MPLSAPPTTSPLDQFREIVLCDFEFGADDGDRQNPVCLTAYELRSGRKHRLWRDQFGATPPYPIGPDTLFVAYLASAEINCHLALGWPVPANVLDLFVEFRCITNGRPTAAGNSLIGALVHHGLDTMSVVEKKEMRDLAIELGRTGRPASNDEKAALLTYCWGDVDALARLLPAMLPLIDLPRALLRGRYMNAVARIETAGIPIDMELLGRLRRCWFDIQDEIITDINRRYGDYGIFEGRVFKRNRFADWLARNEIPWPRLESGQLDLRDDTIRAQAKGPHGHLIAPIHELRSTLADLRLESLAVGHDGRNRTLLSVFRAVTGRNQPSNSKFVFGPARWIRGLIKPPPGHGIAYIDWSQQEIGIAAALSGDTALQQAYLSGDAYFGFAKQAGAVPPDAEARDHKGIRNSYKQTMLGIQYGQQAWGIASRIGCSELQASRLLAEHHQLYRRFWEWSDAAVHFASQHNYIPTVFGWVEQIVEDFNPRSLRNFPMQANGAEMMRLACCFATERGIEVCAPVHDALMICAPLDRLDADIVTTRAVMADASRVILDGFELRTDVHRVPDIKRVRWLDRYMDDGGQAMWDTVMAKLDAAEQKKAAA